MKLYHGTNGRWVENILKRGLEPRGSKPSRNNWKHVPHSSNPKCVYLTNSYAPYFAFNSTRGNDPLCAVLEIETDFLDEGNLFPDEDCLEQCGRRVDRVQGDMSQRTLWYRKHQFEDTGLVMAGDHKPLNWLISLMMLGTCAHRGTIPAKAITRFVRWPHKDKNTLLQFVWDPSITLLNQRFCGERYRALTAKLFGDEIPGEMNTPFDLQAIDRFDAGDIVQLERVNLVTEKV